MKDPVKTIEGMKIEKHCPNCGSGASLVVRTNRSNGRQFLGCERWPDCAYTEQMPESILMRAMGQPRLL